MTDVGSDSTNRIVKHLLRYDQCYTLELNSLLDRKDSDGTTLGEEPCYSWR